MSMDHINPTYLDLYVPAGVSPEEFQSLSVPGAIAEFSDTDRVNANYRRFIRGWKKISTKSILEAQSAQIYVVMGGLAPDQETADKMLINSYGEQFGEPQGLRALFGVVSGYQIDPAQFAGERAYALNKNYSE